MAIFGKKEETNETNDAIFADKTFRSGARKVILKNCPMNIEAFKQLGWDEDKVIEKALNAIYNSYFSQQFRQNKDIVALNFKLPIKKETKTKTLEISKLTEAQKETLKQMGLL